MQRFNETGWAGYETRVLVVRVVLLLSEKQERSLQINHAILSSDHSKPNYFYHFSSHHFQSYVDTFEVWPAWSMVLPYPLFLPAIISRISCTHFLDETWPAFEKFQKNLESRCPAVMIPSTSFRCYCWIHFPEVSVLKHLQFFFCSYSFFDAVPECNNVKRIKIQDLK